MQRGSFLHGLGTRCHRRRTDRCDSRVVPQLSKAGSRSTSQAGSHTRQDTGTPKSDAGVSRTDKGAAEDQLQELDRELPLRGQQVDGFARDLRDAELEIFGEDYDPRAAAKETTDFLSEGKAKDEEKEEKEKDPNLERVGKARDLLSEMEGHAASLKRDIEVVKQTLGMLEAKIRRSAAVADKEK